MADPRPLGLEEDGDAKGYQLSAPPCPSQWTDNFSNARSQPSIFRDLQWEEATDSSEEAQPEFSNVDSESRSIFSVIEFESDEDIHQMSTPLKLPKPESPPPSPPRLLQLSKRGRKRKTSKDGLSEQQLRKNNTARQNYLNRKQDLELPTPLPTSHQQANRRSYHKNKQNRKNTATAKAWVNDLHQKMGSETSSIISQVLNHTPEGQKACESSDRVLGLNKLAQQAAKMIQLCPKQSDKRVEYQSMLQEGQSKEYMKTNWGATDSSIKRSRLTKEKTRTLERIKTSVRTPEEGTRQTLPAAIQLEIINHMKRQGHVNSGANTERYCISSNFTKLYMDYRKCYPDMLRRLHQSNALIMTYQNTQLQKNLVLAVSSTDTFTATVAPCRLHTRKMNANKRKRRFTGNSSSRDTVTLRGEKGMNFLEFTGTDDSGLDSSDISEMFDVSTSSEGSSTSSEYTDENSPKPKKEKKKKKKKKEKKKKKKKRSTEMIYPPTYATWRKVLRNYRNPGPAKSKFLFTLVTQPYSCPVCDTAVQVEHKWLKVTKMTKYYEDNEYTVPLDATAQQKREAEQKWNRDKKKNLNDLANQSAKMKKLEDHRRMYVTQRRHLVASENRLPSRTPLVYKVIVYQDYVAQYDHNGAKCSNLVFTIGWRDANGDLRRKYLDNFCTQKKKSRVVRVTRAITTIP